MAISPVGNAQFVHQNAPVASTHLSNEQAKTNFATVANLSEFQEKEKIVDKLEKVNESHEIKEEVKEKKEEENQKKKQENRQDSNKDDDDKVELVQDEEESGLDEQELEFKNSHKIKRLDLSI